MYYEKFGELQEVTGLSSKALKFYVLQHAFNLYEGIMITLWLFLYPVFSTNNRIFLG
jgi:hypothetical protein